MIINLSGTPYLACFTLRFIIEKHNAFGIILIDIEKTIKSSHRVPI